LFSIPLLECSGAEIEKVRHDLVCGEFNSGNRYADFNLLRATRLRATESLRSFRGVAAKLGFFKGLWVLILGAKKFIIIGVAALPPGFASYSEESTPADGLLIVVRCHNAVTDAATMDALTIGLQRAFFVIPSAVEESLTILLCCRDPRPDRGQRPRLQMH